MSTLKDKALQAATRYVEHRGYDVIDVAYPLPGGEQIDIVDVDNGARLTTYAITGERGSGMISINGAAAHLVHPGDLVILISYGQYSSEELKDYNPRVVFVDAANRQVTLSSDPADVPVGSGLLNPRFPV